MTTWRAERRLAPDATVFHDSGDFGVIARLLERIRRHAGGRLGDAVGDVGNAVQDFCLQVGTEPQLLLAAARREAVLDIVDPRGRKVLDAIADAVVIGEHQAFARNHRRRTTGLESRTAAPRTRSSQAWSTSTPYFALTVADGKLSKVHMPSSARAASEPQSTAMASRTRIRRTVFCQRAFMMWRPDVSLRTALAKIPAAGNRYHPKPELPL